VPALSWYLLSSLAPLALGITALAAIVLGDYAEAQALAERATSTLPKDVHDQIVQLVLRTENDSPLLLLGAVVGMVWTSSGAVGVVERCLSRMLGGGETGMVASKLRNLGVAAGVAILIVASVITASAGTGLVNQIGIDSTLARILVPLVGLAVGSLICAAAFRVLALGALEWPAALAGGAVAGVVLQVTPALAGYYMRFVADNTPAELFLVLTGVLITCYLAALGLLLGVGTAVRAHLGRRVRSTVQITPPA
jgi:uncharacterized BrkB/YihY/UPF0761 family membrane protein